MKWLLLTLMIVATALSDALQSHEMKRAGEQSVGARGLARMLKLIGRRGYLMLAMLLIGRLIFFIHGLGPGGAARFAVFYPPPGGFIFETLLAKFALKERIGRRRAAGVLLVLGGVLLIGQ